MREENLIGWLCMARHQFSQGNSCNMPVGVSDELLRRGWIEACDRTDDCPTWNAHLTEKGIAITDLNAPEWGIDPLPV